MDKTLVLERDLSANHEVDPTQTLLYNLAFALHVIAAESVGKVLRDVRLPLEQREALCLTATREVLSQMQVSLIAAPQSPLTPLILEPLLRADTDAKQQIGNRFPQDKQKEAELADLVAKLRLSIKTGNRK